MRSSLTHAIPVAIAMACASAALAQTPVAETGKQRAAATGQQWVLREAGHPSLGPIVFAILAKPVSTTAAGHAISSNVYVSCERTTAKIAIELVNGRRPDDPLGLKPKSMPKLTCNTLDAKGAALSEPMAANWNANELGDVMARGLWPSSLRACTSIGVTEELALPADWGRDSARVELEIDPYARELDSVFARCGEPAAWPAVTLDAAPSNPPAAAVSSKPATKAGTTPAWTTARTIPEGHTNVRAKPEIRSQLVIRLDPGDVVLVEKSDGEWWRAKSRPNAKNAFEGYIRRDRLSYP